MGYKEYVENCILESGLEETGELLEILESAETLEDVQDIEEYLTEAKAPKVSTAEKLTSLGISRDNAKNSAKNGNSLKHAYDGARMSAAYHSEGNARRKAVKEGRSAGEVDAIGKMAFDKTNENFGKGAIGAGAVALLAAVAGASLKIRSVIRKSKSGNAKQLENQIKDLEDQANDVAKRCKAGEITAKEAKVESKKIEAQIRKLAKEAEKVASTETEKVTKESVMIDIYESERSGNITTEDAETLLALL